MIQYLARYTHKICITNHRIIHYDGQKVILAYTDYRHANKRKTMSLHAHEFIRRYCLHILPKGFTRIRHYGIMSSAWKSRIDTSPKSTKSDWKQLWKEKGLDIDQCPHCKKGKLIFLTEIRPTRGPPKHHFSQQNNTTHV